MIGTIYFIAFLLAILGLAIITNIAKQQDSRYFILIFTTVVFVNMGYWVVATAKSVDVAIVGMQLNYFDGTFVSSFMFLCFLQICGIKIKPFLANLICLVGVIFQMLAMSIGKLNIFYNDASLETNGEISYLVKDYGPTHSAYMVFMAVLMLAPIAVVIYSICHRNRISYRYTIMLGLIEVVTIGVYFVERAMRLKYELIPFALIIDEIILIAIVARISKYDISRSATSSRLMNKEVGYVIFNMDRDFIGCDDNAAMFFPELKRLDIDRKVSDPYIKEVFVDWLDSCIEGREGSKICSKGNLDFRMTVHNFEGSYGSRQVGYIIEIVDDTLQQSYIKELGKINEELEVAAAEARNANMAKSKFLANISHEIRTPINAILGMNEMISREARQDEIVAYSNDIKAAGATLVGLINEVLDLSKIESGKMDLVLVSYDLSSLIRDEIAMANVKAADKGLEFRVEIPDSTPRLLYGDEIRIKQIIANLINNAIKYTEKGYVKFKVGYDKISDTEIKLNVEISDSGIGIKQAELEMLRETFKSDKTSRDKYEAGADWGLSVSQDFLALMDSRIEVDSTFGVGSVFSFSVTQRVEKWDGVGSVNEITLKKQTVAAGYVPSFKAANARILAVDDTSVNLKVVTALLKQTDIKIDLAKSGEEALRMCAETKYDLILLDHMMPGLDGIETLEILRRDIELNAQIPVIALTANAVSGIRDMYIEKGFDDYIPKPINPIDLEKAIVKYLPEELIDER